MGQSSTILLTMTTMLLFFLLFPLSLSQDHSCPGSLEQCVPKDECQLFLDEWNHFVSLDLEKESGNYTEWLEDLQSWVCSEEDLTVCCPPTQEDQEEDSNPAALDLRAVTKYSNACPLHCELHPRTNRCVRKTGGRCRHIRTNVREEE